MFQGSRAGVQKPANSLIMALATPAILVSPEGVVDCANAHALKLFPASLGETLTGKACSALFSAAPDADEHAAPLHLTDGQVLTPRGGGPACLFRVTRIEEPDGTHGGFLLQQVAAQPAPRARPQSSATDRSTATPQDPEAAAGPEFSLAESEWRWKSAVLNANQGVWDHDFETNRHFVSPTWRALRGLSEDDPFPASTEDWLKTIHSQDLDHITREINRLDTGETDIINYKFRQRHKAGHWVWFLSSGSVVRRTPDGLPARMIGTDTDISDIKTVEMESQRMAQRLDIAMEAAGMGRWEHDVGTDYTFWDDRLLKIFGIEDGNNRVSAKAWAEHIHPDDRHAVLALTRDCIAREKDMACDYRLLQQDGTTRYIRTRGKFVKDAERGARYYGVNFDVTADYARAQELENARAKLEHESRHDALTGLANRRYLDDVFSRLISRSINTDSRIAVLHFDIDHFKQINDTMGHDAGDATLKHAAGLLQELLPAGTLVSRVGGDEFVALLPDAPEKAVLADMANRIIEEMAKPYFYAAQQCNIGTSIGIAVADTKGSLDSSIFIHADLALYEAKKAGRGRCRFFTRAMREEARRRKNSFDALLAGFDQGEITCHYQPQFDATTLQVSGLEALVRWESAEFGLIMPDEFLATADDMGLLPQFDELVLQKALQDMAYWEAHGLHIPRVSVNVSSHRLNDPRLVDRFSGLNIPKGKLSFELLESAFLDAKNDIIEANLKMIEEMGIDIEIDDFGSGHASIVSLLQIAPRRLKIDRLLIKPIVSSLRQRDLVATIVEIGRMLDVEVVAEGVESAEHVEILRGIGCRYLQGFALAHPMNAQKIRSFMSDPHQLYAQRQLAQLK
jgi:diguanylate cyclase (GGDEF)-like protein/PAS domain S-box-containing protein